MERRVYYHGSQTGGLKRLEPHLSDQGISCVYLTTNPVIAAIYGVKPVEAPYYFYPYGFSGTTPVYTEYYPGALADLYGGKTGYIYHCSCDPELSMGSPGAIHCSLVSRKPVEVSGYTVLLDLYQTMLEYERSGRLMIRRYETLSQRQLEAIRSMIADEIAIYRLWECPSASYSQFLQHRFPQIWENAVAGR